MFLKVTYGEMSYLNQIYNSKGVQNNVTKLDKPSSHLFFFFFLMDFCPIVSWDVYFFYNPVFKSHN